MNTVLIAGGGIGGLATAIALQHIPVKIRVFERASEMRAVGAGLTLWPNAVSILQHLGLGEALASRGMPYRRATIRLFNGETLSEPPIEAIIERVGGIVPQTIHRADLQAALLSALPSDTISLGAQATDYQQDESGVTLYLADGEKVHGDLLIGADGLHSVLRSKVVPTASLRFASYTTWRAVTQFQSNETLFESWGPGQRLGFVPLADGRIYWFATKNTAQRGNEGTTERKRTILNWFEHWHEPIPSVIKATVEQDILRNDIYDLEPLPHWGDRRVTLLGDAAHALTPDLGQGAAQALEDAILLARSIQQSGPTPEALRTYEQRRRKRVLPLVQQSRLYGWVGQWENPLAATLRALLMRSPLASVQMKTLENIFSYDVFQEDLLP